MLTVLQVFCSQPGEYSTLIHQILVVAPGIAGNGCSIMTTPPAQQIIRGNVCEGACMQLMHATDACMQQMHATDAGSQVAARAEEEERD